MSRNATPPFARGKTLYGAAVATTTTLAATDGAHIVGREFVFEDMDYSVTNAPKPIRSNRPVTVRAVRNYTVVNSGGEITTGALLPKRLVTFKATYYNTAVDGYARTTAVGPAYPVDEFLPATGVALYDVFYIVVQGPAICLSDIASNDTFVYNDSIVALTAATSGATTAGRVDQYDLSGATALLADQVRNSVGRCLSALTATNTNSSMLVDVRRSE